MSNSKKNYEFVEDGNIAWIKYNAVEPLSAEELAVIAGIDLDIWALVEQQPNVWSMGRKNKKVNLEWTNGRADGTVLDTGGFNKTYMYQMKATFVRKEPVAIKPVLRPVSVIVRERKSKSKPRKDRNVSHILFITDPHFGFLVHPFEKPITFHSRPFLSDLFELAKTLPLTGVVWGGDTLDLADFSKFPKKPEVIYKTQIAAIEASWVLNLFAALCGFSVVLEGNHDIRLPNAMAANLSAGYGLKPTDDLDGDFLMSVPRLLGLTTSKNISWAGGYPDERFTYGDVDFKHGNRVLNASGGTVTALLKTLYRSTLFGHIHRPERAERNVEGLGRILVGTPGCACRKGYAPGSKQSDNWGIGAYYITFVDGKWVNCEHIQHHEGETYFRGERWKGIDYIQMMEKDIPEKFMRAL